MAQYLEESSLFIDPPLPGLKVVRTAPAVRHVEDFRSNHRLRLRQRFLDGGAQALPDYELLELVLFRAIPRRDVKPLAKRLLDEFGDFNHVVAAEPDQLKSITGVGDSVVLEIKIVEAAAHRMAKAQIVGKPVLSSWKTLLDYCQTTLSHRQVEQFRVLFLDRRNKLIADEDLGQGTVDHVPVYPREIAKRSLQLNASALILLHNHPSGDPSPSPSDIDMTQNIAEVAHTLGIVLHDHLIIGKGSSFSFRSEGLL